MKTFKYISILIVGLIISITNSYAQFSINKKYLKNLDTRIDTIFVSLKSLSEKEIIKYKKQDILQIIAARIDNENEVLRNEIENDWNQYNIVFVNEQVIEKRLNQKIKTVYLSAIVHNDKYFDKRVGRQRRYLYLQHYDIALWSNKKPVITVPLVNPDLNELDLHFALSIINTFITDDALFHNFHQYTKSVNAKVGEIKNKTLLVSSNSANYSKKYISSIYNFQFEIIKPDEILNKLHNHDDKYVYLMQSLTHSMDNPRFNHFILNSKDDMPVLLYRNSTAYVKPCKHSCFLHQENEKLDYLLDVHFKRFNKIINKNI